MGKPMSQFHTLKGYQLTSHQELTPAMEDYLEMIYRFFKQTRSIRIGELAKELNVKPSSTTKIVQKLRELGYVDFEKYGKITLTEKGCYEGEYLLLRHEILHQFLCLINHSTDELEQVEKIEHFMDQKTIINIQAFLENYEALKNK